MISDRLLALAPMRLPILRTSRYCGGGFGVLLGDLAWPDRERARRIYDAVRAVADARPEPGQPPSARFLAAVRHVGSDAICAAAHALGAATPGAGAGLLAKVLHDVRSGTLAALVGTASWLAAEADAPVLPAACGPLARDHCKIMRNAFPDLDPPRRRYDEQRHYHGMGELIRTWDGTTVRAGGRPPARVSVTCEYWNGLTGSCLENAAVERVLSNHVNNAARFAADGRVDVSVFEAGAGRVRWVVSNAVAASDRQWLAAHGGPGLRDLYLAGRTHGGNGIGLSACADFVAAAFGVESPAEAVAGGYLGATVLDGEYLAWFHWPAYAPGGL